VSGLDKTSAARFHHAPDKHSARAAKWPAKWSNRDLADVGGDVRRGAGDSVDHRDVDQGRRSGLSAGCGLEPVEDGDLVP
jgi:hypothetical protein